MLLQSFNYKCPQNAQNKAETKSVKVHLCKCNNYSNRAEKSLEVNEHSTEYFIDFLTYVGHSFPAWIFYRKLIEATTSPKRSCPVFPSWRVRKDFKLAAAFLACHYIELYAVHFWFSQWETVEGVKRKKQKSSICLIKFFFTKLEKLRIVNYLQ